MTENTHTGKFECGLGAACCKIHVRGCGGEFPGLSQSTPDWQLRAAKGKSSEVTGVAEIASPAREARGQQDLKRTVRGEHTPTEKSESRAAGGGGVGGVGGGGEGSGLRERWR